MTVRGTFIGEYLGIPPNGKQITAEGIMIHRIAGGQLVEHWAIGGQFAAVPAARRDTATRTERSIARHVCVPLWHWFVGPGWACLPYDLGLPPLQECLRLLQISRIKVPL